MSTAKTPIERFHNNYIPEPNSGCWLWIGVVADNGYGQMKIKGRHFSGHRLSWIIHKGSHPGPLSVCHKCDVPCCVNPDHLWLGTAADNAADRTRKGRSIGVSGESHPFARLTAANVLAIRADVRPTKEIAAIYSVSERLIQMIRRRQCWTCLP